MATAAQITANQQNAHLSTGPKTEQGKQASSQNARKHGLSAKEFVLLPGEEDAFHELATQYAEELRPEGILEHTVFTLLLQADWNLRRCRRNEAALLTPAGDPLLDGDLDKTIARLDRYARRHERLFFKALKELKALQAARAATPVPAPAPVPTPVQNEPKPQAAPSVPSPNAPAPSAHATQKPGLRPLFPNQRRKR